MTDRRKNGTTAAPAAPYRKLEIGLWTDQRFARLSRPQPNAQSLWVYLLAGPRTMNIPGIVVAREAVIADDLRWPVEGFREAFREVMQEGMAEADWDAGVVVLSKAFFDGRGQPRSVHRPQSINVVIGWAKRWDEIPECQLKDRFYWSIRAFLKAFGEDYEEAFAKACPKPSPIQEQEKEQERDAPLALALSPAPGAPGAAGGAFRLGESVGEGEAPEKARKPTARAKRPRGARRAQAAKPAEKAKPSDHVRARDRWHELYRARYGRSPTWTGEQGAMLKRLLDLHGCDQVVASAERLMTSPPAWMNDAERGAFDFGFLVRHFDKLAVPAGPVQTEAERERQDEYRRLLEQGPIFDERVSR